METPNNDFFATAANNAAVSDMSPHHARQCLRCGGLFEARKHGGGKPQKYCGEKCRTADYADKQRQESAATSCLKAERTTPHEQLPRGPSSQRDEYDWPAAVVVRDQQAIAMYWDPAGNLVIRQERSFDEEFDSCIVVNADNVERLYVHLKHQVEIALGL